MVEALDLETSPLRGFMIELGLLFLFMWWAYRRGRRLEKKAWAIAQGKEKVRDHAAMRRQLQKELDEILRQQDEDFHKLLLNANEEDQVEYLSQLYGDEEE